MKKHYLKFSLRVLLGIIPFDSIYVNDYINIYQKNCKVYLDEYPEQKEERKEFFAKRWNLQNESLKRMS